MDKLKDRNFNCLVGDKNEISWSNMDTSEIELEEELLKTHVSIDVNKLAKSNIKQIKMPLHRFIEWVCLSSNGQIMSKSEVFDSCLTAQNSKKAKTLNKLYQSRIWSLLGDEITKDMNFEDFVN